MTEKKKLQRILYVIVLVIASLPAFTFYVPERGWIHFFLGRLDELQNGFSLFPSLDLCMAHQISVQGLSSNLMYFLPAILYKLTKNIHLTYTLFILGLQILTFMGCILFYKKLTTQNTWFLWGLLLYMTFPFRAYVCYDSMDFSQALFWMILPFYGYAFLGLMKKEKLPKNAILTIVFGSLLAYCSIPHFLVAFGFSVAIAVCKLDYILLPVTLLEILPAFPALKQMLVFLKSEDLGVIGISMGSIMPNGYTVAQMFNSFSFTDGRPGFGLGLCFVIGLLIWYSFVERKEILGKGEKTTMVLALLLLIGSTMYFPWDFAQRVRPFTLKLIALLETPGIFFQFACVALTIPASKAMDKIIEDKDKNFGIFIAILLFFLCLATAAYQENTIVFLTMPAVFE